MSSPLLNRFTHFDFASEGIAHRIYRAGDAAHPPLLVLPEIAGVAPGLLMFAERLIAARYQVYIPWLFGPLGERAPVRNALRLCISREFANLRAGVSAPVTAWIRALASHISETNGGGRVGAIGMCLTGAFVIPLIIDPKVVAAVAAQPSVPMSLLFARFGVGGGSRRSELNVSDEHIAAARARLDAGAAHMLAVRCRADRICPPEKLARLQREFPVGLEVRQYGRPEDRNPLGDRPHATFTKEYRLVPDAGAEHHSRQALSDLLAFFERHLRSGQA